MNSRVIRQLRRFQIFKPGITLALFLFCFCGSPMVVAQPPQASSSAAAQSKPKLETDSQEQYEKIAEAIKANSYSLSISGNKLEGPGAEFLMKKVSSTQFVLIGEEHNVKQVPQFTAALFHMLHQCCGYNYLALESDPVSAHVASLPPLKSNVNSIFHYANQFPNAFTFATDEELEMIADVEKVSTGKTDAIWGLDQSFGVLHSLEELRRLRGVNTNSEMFQQLLKDSESRDSKRFAPNSHYMAEVVKLEDLEKLRQEIAPRRGTEAEFILDNLVSSSRIFTNFIRGTKGEHTGYISGLERENEMKKRFLRSYRNAQHGGDQTPRALLKLGHWHLFRGLGPSSLPTLGNFVSDFAMVNGYDSFSIAVFIHGSPNNWREIGEWKGMKPFGMAASADSSSLVDFQPLRAGIFAGDFGTVNPTLRSYIFGFDAALIIANGSPATTTVLSSSHTQ